MTEDKLIKININPRGGKASNRFPITIELLENSTVEELKKLIQDSSRVSLVLSHFPSERVLMIIVSN